MLDSLSFHHIGYAVKSIKDTADFYIRNGWVLTEECTDPIQNTIIAFLKKDGFPLIELVAPIDDKSPIEKTLKKGGVSPYHICYSVDNIEETVAELRKEKFMPLFKPVSAVALDNHKICYLYNQNVGLIELVEK